MKKCKERGCNNPIQARLQCWKHYQYDRRHLKNWHKYVGPSGVSMVQNVDEKGNRMVCYIKTCQKYVVSKGMCEVHYQREYMYEVRSH